MLCLTACKKVSFCWRARTGWRETKACSEIKKPRGICSTDWRCCITLCNVQRGRNLHSKMVIKYISAKKTGNVSVKKTQNQKNHPPTTKNNPKKENQKNHQSLWCSFPIWRNKARQISPRSQTTHLKSSPVPWGSSFRATAGHRALGPCVLRLWDTLPAPHVLGQLRHLNQDRATE